jgi:hypothetical protein
MLYLKSYLQSVALFIVIFFVVSRFLIRYEILDLVSISYVTIGVFCLSIINYLCGLGIRCGEIIVTTVACLAYSFISMPFIYFFGINIIAIGIVIIAISILAAYGYNYEIDSKYIIIDGEIIRNSSRSSRRRDNDRNTIAGRK